MFIATIPVQDVNQAFLTKKKVPQNSADVVSSSVSSSSSKFLLILVIFTALHGMQTRSCDENSVCLSVCLSNASIVTK